MGSKLEMNVREIMRNYVKLEEWYIRMSVNKVNFQNLCWVIDVVRR